MGVDWPPEDQDNATIAVAQALGESSQYMESSRSSLRRRPTGVRLGSGAGSFIIWLTQAAVVNEDSGVFAADSPV